jgi:hypothetical protein
MWVESLEINTGQRHEGRKLAVPGKNKKLLALFDTNQMTFRHWRITCFLYTKRMQEN